MNIMSTNSGGNRRIVKNTGLLYIRMLFVMCITLFTTRIVLKALGVVDYGVYNVIAGFIALFTVLNNSLTTGTNRFYNYAIGQKNNYRMQQVYNAALRIQLLFVIVLVVLLETIGVWYLNTKMVIPAERIYVAKNLTQNEEEAPEITSIMIYQCCCENLK